MKIKGEDVKKRKSMYLRYPEAYEGKAIPAKKNGDESFDTKRCGLGRSIGSPGAGENRLR